ncbi:sensor histidine kinase [Pseudofulvibacter geojedonensis]|uniref:Sensor histidine kinase n=1 Tax=Pseudofulvibacter geojedonensis TaxID=1123758 RepID=A0ABW3I642_9FLAO
MLHILKKHILFHFLFWSFILCFVLDYFYDGSNLIQALKHAGIECTFYALIAYINLLIILPFFKEKPKIIYIISLIAFLSILLSIYLGLKLDKVLMNYDTTRNSISFSLNFTLFTIISYLYWFLILFFIEKHRHIQLKTEKLQAELELLKSQVSPHFLFNSLNNIYALAVTKSEHTPEMIEKLSDILRYLLEDATQHKVPITKEADLIQKYIDLQHLKKVKANNHISYLSNGLTPQISIPPLLLINFVENAFKHSDIQYNKEGFLHINLSIDENDNVEFEIENSKDKKMNTLGIGLSNTRKQLDLYYQGNYSLDINNTISSFKVTLILPGNVE